MKSIDSAASEDHGFTLIELLVVIAIVATFTSLLFPVFAKAKRQAVNSVCLSNLWNLHLAMVHYTDDYDDAFPPLHFAWDSPSGKLKPAQDPDAAERNDPTSLRNLFMPYVKAPEVFHCPLDTGLVTSRDTKNGTTSSSCFERFGYSYRPAAELGGYLHLTTSEVPDPAALFWAPDGAGYRHTRYSRMPSTAQVDNTGEINDIPRWTNNTVFLDGHTRASDFYPDVWNPFIDFVDSKLTEETDG